MTEELCQKPLKSAGVIYFALPYRQDTPASFAKGTHTTPIPPAVHRLLRGPKGFIGLRYAASPTGVSVPETTVHKDDRLVAWEDYVRLPRKIGAIQSEAKSHRMNQSSDHQLGLRVFAPYTGHALRTLDSRHRVQAARS